MIAAVKRWHAGLCALLFFIPPGAPAAEDLNGAARELAHQTATFAGPGEPVSVEYRNASSLGAAELGQARAAFEAALKEAGLRVSDVAPVAELRLTLSENQSQYLLVEEARKGDERQVWMAAWKRAEPAAAALPGMALDRKLVWEQEEQILDVAFPAAGMLVLSPSKVTLYTQSENGSWEPRQAVPLAPGKPWPRDLRGRLRRTTTWIPLEKVQSVRWVQGPVQRRLGLASVRLDVAGRRVTAALQDRSVAEAGALLRRLPALARTARAQAGGRPRRRT